MLIIIMLMNVNNNNDNKHNNNNNNNNNNNDNTVPILARASVRVAPGVGRLAALRGPAVAPDRTLDYAHSRLPNYLCYPY